MPTDAASAMFETLREKGFQIAFQSHARAILSVDFPEVARQLETILREATIPIEEIIGSGGGETKGTQRLRRALHDQGWHKHQFQIQRTIDGVPRESVSHEVDHVHRFDAGVVALEIEWNNKDPFFDGGSGELQALACGRSHIAWDSNHPRDKLAGQYASDGAQICDRQEDRIPS